MTDIVDTLTAKQRAIAELTMVSVKLSWIQDAIRAVEKARDNEAALRGHVGDIVDDIARGALVNAAEIGNRLADLTSWPIEEDDRDLLPGTIPLDTPLDNELGKLQAGTPSRDDERGASACRHRLASRRRSRSSLGSSFWSC